MNLSLHKKKCLTYKQLSNITTAESLYLTEFTYKALSACKLDTVNSITNQLFGIKNIFSSGKNVINGNYLPRQEHKRLLNVYSNDESEGSDSEKSSAASEEEEEKESEEAVLADDDEPCKKCGLPNHPELVCT